MGETQTPDPRLDDETTPLLVPIARAAHLLGFCRATIYRMEKAQQIRIVRPRKRAMVPMSEVERIVKGEPMRDDVGGPVGEPKKRKARKRQYHPTDS